MSKNSSAYKTAADGSSKKELMGECIPFFILLPYLSAPLPICNFQVISMLDKPSILEHNKLHRRQKTNKIKGVFVMEQKKNSKQLSSLY